MTDVEICERMAAMFGRLIGEAMDALAEIEHSGVAAQGGVRVQGGVRIAVEERAMLATERMRGFPPKIVAVARVFRNAPDSKTRAYITALLAGKSGAALRQQTKINAATHARMKQWLMGVIRRAGVDV